MHGILHEQSVPKTPQHNGLAKRMNRTIVEKVRCLLSHSNLPTIFWGEALFATMQIINLSPTTILEGEVPKVVWSRKKVSYKHLRVFGFRAFVHVSKDERSKLDNKLRHGDDKFGYKLYDPVTKKVVRSRDLVFFEDQTINMSNGAAELGVGNDIVVDDVFEEDRSTNEQDEVHSFQEIGAEFPVQESEQVARNLSSAERVDTGPAPICYQEAIEREDKLEWVSAMKDEINSLTKNSTYILVDRVPNRKIWKNRWVFKLKKEEGKSSLRYKARLVVKGSATFH
ncbi:hypothetical protein LIER_36540 [Lithospermum erythrorhizon]|uniref:Integrase catalytic domain-containing protein n=1 Tax=Lithospermum erythrorhizon TaxID=34254 RepID=A0AAV3P887_LITER